MVLGRTGTCCGEHQCACSLPVWSATRARCAMRLTHPAHLCSESSLLSLGEEGREERVDMSEGVFFLEVEGGGASSCLGFEF